MVPKCMTEKQPCKNSESWMTNLLSFFSRERWLFWIKPSASLISTYRFESCPHRLTFPLDSPPFCSWRLTHRLKNGTFGQNEMSIQLGYSQFHLSLNGVYLGCQVMCSYTHVRAEQTVYIFRPVGWIDLKIIISVCVQLFEPPIRSTDKIEHQVW